MAIEAIEKRGILWPTKHRKLVRGEKFFLSLPTLSVRTTVDSEDKVTICVVDGRRGILKMHYLEKEEINNAAIRIPRLNGTIRLKWKP